MVKHICWGFFKQDEGWVICAAYASGFLKSESEYAYTRHAYKKDKHVLLNFSST